MTLNISLKKKNHDIEYIVNIEGKSC